MSKEIVTIESALKLPARRVATKAIENVHLAYYVKGGIRATVETLQTQLASASHHVFAIAKYAAKAHSDSLEQATALYIAMCEYAEQAYKQEHEVENLREALPTWATYKSNILRGLRSGLNPLEFRTEKVYRSKTMELVSRAPRDPEPRAGPQAVLEPDELETLVSSTAVPDALKQLVAQVVFAAEVVNVRKLEQAEEILREAWQRLGALTDKRKLK